MKIALLAFSSLPHIGGAQVFMYNLCRRLIDRGHTVHVLLPYYWYKRYRNICIAEKTTIIPFCAKELFLLEKFPMGISAALASLQAINRYDVWQILGSYPAAYVARFLGKRVPTVMRSYGMDIQIDPDRGYGSRLDPKRALRIRKGLCGMSRLVALSRSIAECFQELGVAAERIVEIPNGIDLSRFRNTIDRHRIRREMGILPKETVLLTVGRHHIIKGHEYIPQAARRLADEGYSFKWVIVGKDVGVIRPLIEHFGVSGHMILHPEVRPAASPGGALRVPPDALVHLYRAADIFVLPSLIEGLSNVLLEAIAAGLAVVATDCPGNRQVIVDRHNGLLAHTCDALSLAACVSRMISDPNLTRAMKRQAFEDIQQYSWEKVAHTYEQLYAQLAGHTFKSGRGKENGSFH